jgi:dolichyl-phosphate-mannose-protein mannosyltransferase
MVEIVTSLMAVFVLRFVLSFLPSFQVDMATWIGWAGRLASLGFAKFYSPQVWTQYTPGFLYYLWAIGKLGWASGLAIKIPVILADMAVGGIIYSLVKKVNKNLALVLFFFYVLNPVVIFDGSVWGQIDGILTLALFLSAYFLIEKKNFIWSSFFWSLAFLIKPQAIAVLPVFLIAAILKKFDWRKILAGAVVSLLTIFVGSILFFPNDPIMGLPKLLILMSNSYPYTSVNAFNVWTWIGMWIPDKTVFAGLSLAVWGTVFLLASIIFVFYFLRDKLDKKYVWYLLFAILSLCFFLFPTKVHERYLFPFFAFLLTAVGLSKSKNLFRVYILGSVANFLNLFYAYAYYNPVSIRLETLFALSRASNKLVGFAFILIFFFLVFWDKLPEFEMPKLRVKKSTVESFPKISLSKNVKRNILYLILGFAFVTRVFSLGSPSTMYFDEVYHAFTAKVMMGVDAAKAWEWWNTPPPGFAYEWTHPPLAKFGMVLGMSVFGQDSFGWRIPGALLGVGAVFLIYLLAKEIFKDEVLGLLSAGIFSLDGLPLVMSRIGMNDSYILFFALASIYLFMRQKDFLSALCLGLALASKWSALWAAPIIFVLWLKRQKKFTVSIAWFLLLPPAVYILSYIPMFTTGHTFTTWWNLQEQMWWYHTGLRATHPYTSPWWSWPFMIRPIYLYTSEEIGGMVARIYAIGNPFVFWIGITSVAICAVYSYLEKNKNLGLVVFSYLIFFAPWAASPRIMFLYHYLPSIPFMCIAIAYVLRRTPKLIPMVLTVFFLAFVYFYPHWAGLPVPLWLDKSYYWFPSWR